MCSELDFTNAGRYDPCPVVMAPSSSGLGLQVFILATRVRVPPGSPFPLLLLPPTRTNL